MQPKEPPSLTDQIQRLLIFHEGVRLMPYQDTVGKWTIGVGRNLSDCGIRSDEMHLMLVNDMSETIEQLYQKLPWVRSLSLVRQAVLADMAFNMGLGNTKRGLLSFRNTLKRIEEGYYEAAAKAMLQSKWAKQVGQRAIRLSTMMATDHWPDDIPG